MELLVSVLVLLNMSVVADIRFSPVWRTDRATIAPVKMLLLAIMLCSLLTIMFATLSMWLTIPAFNYGVVALGMLHAVILKQTINVVARHRIERVKGWDRQVLQNT